VTVEGLGPIDDSAGPAACDWGLVANLLPVVFKGREYHTYCVENVHGLLANSYSALERVLHDYLVCAMVLRLDGDGHGFIGEVVNGARDFPMSFEVRCDHASFNGVQDVDPAICDASDVGGDGLGGLDPNLGERLMLVGIDEVAQFGQQGLPEAVPSSVGLAAHDKPASTEAEATSLRLPLLNVCVASRSVLGGRIRVLIPDRKLHSHAPPRSVSAGPREIVEARTEVCQHITEYQGHLEWLDRLVSDHDRFVTLAWLQAQRVGWVPLAINLESGGSVAVVVFELGDGVVEQVHVSMRPFKLEPSWSKLIGRHHVV